ncbi:MAG: HNH endonuclease signature motif containing protein [Microthrixaceae bacterium]
MELQEYLLSRVPGRRFERWAAELRALCAELDEDGPEPDDGERDSLVISETGGVTVISGCVHGSEGEELSQAIEAETERLYRRAQADAKACPDLVVPGWMTLRAKALLELIRRAQHTCTTNGRQAGADITLIVHAEQTQPADTDTDAPDEQPDEQPAGTAASTPAVPPGGHASEPWMGPVFRPDGTPLAHTPGTVDANLWRLCCTANIRSFVVDGDDLPIWATLNQRLASPLQRRMVLVRDGGCVFPGCDAPLAWIQIHHVIPAAAGGPTEPTNLAALCAHHHGVTHRTGWHMTANTGPTGLPNGRFTWTTPTGHTIDSQRHQAWQPPEQQPDHQDDEQPADKQPVPPTPIRTRRARPPNRPPSYPDTG